MNTSMVLWNIFLLTLPKIAQQNLSMMIIVILGAAACANVRKIVKKLL